MRQSHKEGHNKGLNHNLLHERRPSLTNLLHERRPSLTIEFKKDGSPIVKCKFDEATESPKVIIRKDVSMPFAIVKKGIFWVGVSAIIGLCVIVGLGLKPITTSKDIKKDITPVDYSQNNALLQSTLKDILKRQDVLKTIITTNIANRKVGAVENNVKQEKFNNVEQEKFEDVFNKQMKELELRQLLDLEQKKVDLVIRDQELADQGLKSLHPERQSVISTLNALDQRIKQLKEKYGFHPI